MYFIGYIYQNYDGQVMLTTRARLTVVSSQGTMAETITLPASSSLSLYWISLMDPTGGMSTNW